MSKLNVKANTAAMYVSDRAVDRAVDRADGADGADGADANGQLGNQLGVRSSEPVNFSHCKTQAPKLSINGDPVDSEQWGRRLRIAFELADPHQLKEQLARHVHVSNAEGSTGTDTNTDTDTDTDTDTAAASNFDPDNPRHLRHALYTLSVKENSDVATQLELLVRFDDIEGWRESGAKHCADWVDTALGIDRRSAWERLRIGRKLRLLPVIQHLFRCGRLSWSKVRILVAVADPDNEEKLAHAALDASVRDVQRLCNEYRWPETEDEAGDQTRAEKQHERRRLSWQQLDDGSTLIQLVLPPEKAQNFLHAVEHCEDLQYRSEPAEGDSDAWSELDSELDPEPPTPSQRMADAAVLMAERSLAYRGIDLSVADRYLTVMNIDARSLVSTSAPSPATAAVSAPASAPASASAVEPSIALTPIPPRKPYIEGIGPIPVATARALTCDCSLIGIQSDKDGEPLSIGRRSRIWTPQLRLLITQRDRHCQFPGCSQHRFLHIHHIKHWADGGETSVDNGVCLCSHHHSLIHSGQFTIERNVIDAEKSVDLHTGKTLGLESSAKRQLLPTRCRFRVTRVRGGPHDSLDNLPRPWVYEACCSETASHKKTGHGPSSKEASSCKAAVNDKFSSVNTAPQQQSDDNKCRDGEIPMYCASPSVVMDLTEISYIDKTVHSSHSLHIECSPESVP